MIGNFEKRYQMNVSLLQAAVLMLYNEHESLNVDQIRSMTNIEHLQTKDLKRHLISLIKIKLLVKSSSGGEGMGMSDDISLNPGFSSRHLKFNVTLPSIKNTAQAESKEVTEKLADDRKHYLEAVLVRIMKSRKTLSHTELVEECLKQSRGVFQPDIVQIKGRIESLIEKEYLARDMHDRATYKYLA